jgi:hypothetical protein
VFRAFLDDVAKDFGQYHIRGTTKSRQSATCTG